MPTQMLTREEMHDRVDYLFDVLEERWDEEPIALIGDIDGSAGTNAPSDSKNYYRARAGIGYAPFSFDRLVHGEGVNRIAQGGANGLFGTLVVPRSDLADVVQQALDGDEAAIEALESGEVPG